LTFSFSFNIVSAQTGMAVVSIVTREQGLPVFVDGVQAGITPLKHFSISAGRHEISVRRVRSESWLDTDWSEKYNLVAGDTLDIYPVFKRGYMINSTPFGAEVLVDHTYQGTTPLVLYFNEDRKSEVEVRMHGYESQTATIDSTSQRRLQITLLEDSDILSSQETEQKVKISRRSHFLKLTKIAGAVSAASGVTAILLKRQADNFYQDYLTASDPRQITALFNRTSQYDEYAGTAFIVFQISFGLSFYWFLRSTTSE
jgi:hypothetical protein